MKDIVIFACQCTPLEQDTMTRAVNRIRNVSAQIQIQMVPGQAEPS